MYPNPKSRVFQPRLAARSRQEGAALYVANCYACHGLPGVERGMPDFTGKLSNDDVEALKAFIQGTADAIRPKN